MNAWTEFVARHKFAEGLGSGVLLAGYLRTWPKLIPRKAQDWWTWSRNAIQYVVGKGRDDHDTTSSDGQT